MYWNPLDVLFVWFSVILNFYISRSERISKSVKLISCVTFNAGYLLALKIFVSSGAGSASNEALAFSALGLPLGISFITFQQISFVIDQAEGRDREPSFARYLFFVMFFPQLISGPIVKHSRLIPQIYRKTFSRFTSSFASVGFVTSRSASPRRSSLPTRLQRQTKCFLPKHTICCLSKCG